VWSFVVLFVSCVCVCDLFLFLQAIEEEIRANGTVGYPDMNIICICMHACMHAYMHTCIYIYRFNPRFSFTPLCSQAIEEDIRANGTVGSPDMYIICICIHACMHAYMHTYICIYISGDPDLHLSN